MRGGRGETRGGYHLILAVIHGGVDVFMQYNRSCHVITVS